MSGVAKGLYQHGPAPMGRTTRLIIVPPANAQVATTGTSAHDEMVTTVAQSGVASSEHTGPSWVSSRRASLPVEMS